MDFEQFRFPRSPYHVSPRTGKTLYKCSAVATHRLTAAQARASGWMCTHCGAELKARKNKVQELESLAEQLGYKLWKK